jgi:DNA polymerase-3 subunit delta'
LQRAVATGRIAHAYLFHGIEGIGKKTCARMFARALNCEAKDVHKIPCDACVSCVKISHGNHPDVITVKPDGVFIKIKAIRDLQSQTKFRPFEGAKRVFLIEDAERMNDPAANALLKTLEEPNPSNVLILITARPYQLPATILSRCQKIRFDPLAKEIIGSFLKDSGDLDEHSADVFASTSMGSIGKALDMKEKAQPAAITELIEKYTASDAAEDPLALFVCVDYFGDTRDMITERLRDLRNWYRDVLIYKETGDSHRLLHPNLLRLTRRYAEKISGRGILRNVGIINDAYRAIEYNANKQLTLETMMFKLLHV